MRLERQRKSTRQEKPGAVGRCCAVLAATRRTCARKGAPALQQRQQQIFPGGRERRGAWQGAGAHGKAQGRTERRKGAFVVLKFACVELFSNVIFGSKSAGPNSSGLPVVLLCNIV